MSWETIDRLFHAAAGLAPSDRGRFLDSECAGDPALRAKLDALLAADAGAEHLLQEIVFRESASLSAVAPHPLEGARLGPYEIIREIGRGGMGEVFLARRADREFDKQVAIKLVRAGLDPEARRFFQERQILARLEHPNIARLLDGGTTPDARPYLVMEYVEGVPIVDYRAARNLSVEQCCRLFLQVCDAVGYAHRNLIVHRDIKPGNILVDATGTPKLLDFGIAKLLEADGPEADATTVAARPLTPHYASPEQIGGGAITTATDVYMLGEVLFELLTGRRAHQIASTAPGELERVICLTPVDRPSDANPAWRRKLAGDLDNIVLHALQKDPERRYSSVDHFAEDLRRYLDGRPVTARPDTLGYRFRKLVRRHPGTAAVAALLVISIGAGVASTVREKRRTERRFSEVRQLANVFLFDFENAIRNVPGTADARQLVIRTGLQYLERLSRDAGDNPALEREVAAAYVKMGDLQNASNINSVSVKGNVGAAIDSFRQAIQLLCAIGAPQSSDLDLRREYIAVLGTYARAEGARDLKASLRDGQEAVRLAEKLERESPGDRKALSLVAGTALQLAPTQQRSDLSSAVATARKAASILTELVGRFPLDSELRPRLAEAYMRLSMIHTELFDWPNVAQEGARAVEILEQLHAANPSDHPMAKRLMIAYHQLGKGLHNPQATRFQQEQGLVYLRKSVDLAEQIHTGDPVSSDALNDFSATHSVLGNRLTRSGDFSGGLAYLQRAAQSAQMLAERDPTNRETRVTWAIDITFIATNKARQRDWAAAVALRRQADAIMQDLLRNSPLDIRVLNLVIDNWAVLGEVCLNNGDAAAANRYADLAMQTAARVRRTFPPEAVPANTFADSEHTAAAVLARLKH